MNRPGNKVRCFRLPALIAACLVGFVSVLNGQQILSQGSLEVDEKYLWRVKQLDQFIGRFNYEESLSGNPMHGNGEGHNGNSGNMPEAMKDAAADSMRRLVIMTLFDLVCKDCFDMGLVNEFLDQVTDENNPVKLDFYDDNWYAGLKTQIKYKGTPMDISLTMENEAYPGPKSKWVIAGADGPFIEHVDPAGQVEKHIHPMSHETDFIDLERAFSDRSNIELYAARTYRHDNLSQLFDKVKSKEIVYQGVKNTKYHFLQVQGWIFVVEHFERNSKNSGWLISKLIKADSREKAKYKVENLHLYTE